MANVLCGDGASRWCPKWAVCLSGSRRLLTAFTALAVLGVTTAANAGLVLVDPSDWDGSRVQPLAATTTSRTENGLTTNGSWTDQFLIDWNITFDGTLYTYTYHLADSKTGSVYTPLSQEISHWILQVSDSFTAANIFPGSSDFLKSGGNFVEPTDYSEGGSNPLMPGAIYGIKFDEVEGAIEYVLVTDRAPVWGSFYAKNGNNQPFSVAWNSGFTSTSSRPEEGETNFTNWIPTPDTVGPPVGVPEPASLLVFGGLGLLLAGRRHRSRRAVQGA